MTTIMMVFEKKLSLIPHVTIIPMRQSITLPTLAAASSATIGGWKRQRKRQTATEHLVVGLDRELRDRRD